MKKAIPNIISATRLIIAVPAALALQANQAGLFLSLLLWQIVGDRLDGFLARRWKSESYKGKILDSAADITFFIVIFLVMLNDSHYYRLAVYFLPGIILGAVALVIRMAKLGRRFILPVRPINHVSFILYAAIISMFYYPDAVLTEGLGLIAAAAISISAVILFYRAILLKTAGA